jgi:CDP-diglyceride synthetase
MSHLKGRLLGVLLILLFAALTYYNWHQLQTEGKYSLKLAAFGPVGVVGGLFLLLFPSMGGRPETARAKVVVLLVFVVGLAAGLVNWYLMDPGFFGR